MSSMKTDRFVPMSTGKNMEPLSLPECVHLTERCRCGVLRVEECQGERCAFRKTERAYSTAYQKWRDALRAKSAEEQRRTASKYYGGQMPWTKPDC